jgi:hypothetical protein
MQINPRTLSFKFCQGETRFLIARLTRAVILLGALLLAGCGVAPLVEPGKPVLVKDLSLASPLRWSQFGDARNRFWTIDGSILNGLRIFADVKPGEHIFLEPKGRQERKGEGLLFRAEMSELEVQELLADALKNYGAINVRTRNLRPAKFGARPGFRFDISFERGSGLALEGRGGLKYQGMVLAETAGGTLSYLYFDAPAEYYFPREQANVEKIFNSVIAP